mgnify:CR=1 FL=1
MVRRFALALAVLVVLCGMAGCGDKSRESSDTQTSETYYTAPPLLTFDISGLITRDEVGEIIGREMDEAMVLEDHTILQYYAADQSASVRIAFEKLTRQEFDQKAALMVPNAADAPNLGETAKWDAESRSLMVYGRGHMIEISTDIDNESADSQLTKARSLTALLLERLPTEASADAAGE